MYDCNNIFIESTTNWEYFREKNNFQKIIKVFETVYYTEYVFNCLFEYLYRKQNKNIHFKTCEYYVYN